MNAPKAGPAAPGLLIASVIPEDAAEVLDYVRTVGAETEYLLVDGAGLDLDVDEEAALIDRLGASGDGFFLKGVVDGRIVGIVSVQRGTRPRTRHVARMGISVLRAYWGRGFGRALLTAALRRAEAAGCAKVELGVRRDNTRALGLYRGFGFRLEGIRSDAIRVDGQSYDELEMALDLGQ